MFDSGSGKNAESSRTRLRIHDHLSYKPEEREQNQCHTTPQARVEREDSILNKISNTRLAQIFSHASTILTRIHLFFFKLFNF